MTNQPRSVRLHTAMRFGLFVGTLTLASCGPLSLAEAPTRTLPPATTVAEVQSTSVVLSGTLGNGALSTAVPPSPTPLPTLAPTRRPTATPEPTITPLPTSTPTEIATSETLTAVERMQVFEEVWSIVNEHYLYPDFHGLDWDSVREEYAPRVEDAATNDQFYAEIAEMIALLNDHHSRFLPPADVAAENTLVSGSETSVGIGVIITPTQEGGFIQLVFPDSPADRAGLRPRDRIIAVDGKPYHPEDADVQGPSGSTVRLNIVRPGDKPRDVVLVRQEVQGRITPYYRRFPGDIGYVSIPTLWVNDMDEQVSGALTELVAAGQLQGLILDLRGNGGGWRHVLSGILSHFVRGPVGKFFDQRESHTLSLSSPPGPDLRRLPLVVLIDQDTASYAEVLAAVLQYEADAQIVGTPSSGNTETIYGYLLTDGSRLWLAQEGFRLQNGVNLEGEGVQPDSLVDIDWKRYSEEDDPQLLEGLRLLGAGPK